MDDLLNLIGPGRRVVVWGYGRHGGGQAAATFCAAHGATVTILDAQPADAFPAAAQSWPWLIGDGTHDCLRSADLIVASPAIPPRAWRQHHARACSPEGLFFALHRGPRIAVTGSKGKSTTAALIAGLTGWPLAGNGWEPLLDFVVRCGPSAPVVCELSSFQAWYLRDQQPRLDLAVLTSLACDHLDWHPDLDHYQRSKLALFGWAERVISPRSLHQRLRSAGVTAPPLPPLAQNDSGWHQGDDQTIAALTDLRLPGIHNRENAGLALAVALAVGIDPGVLAQRLRGVAPLPHRLQPVHQIGNLHFIDDSIATMPDAAIAALASMSGPLAIIVGGSDKGADYVELGRAIAARGAIACAIGQTGPRITAAITAAGGVVHLCFTLERAVAVAAAELGGHGTVVLSPACASFDQFSDFADRGARFIALVRALVPPADGESSGA